MKLKIGQCYSLAWKGFSKWWIPLCLISGVLFIFEILPEILLRTDMEKIEESIWVILRGLTGDPDELVILIEEIEGQMWGLIMKTLRFGAMLFPFGALATVLLLMYANWASKGRRGERRHLGWLIYISFVHVVMACLKIFAFFCFIVPGAYLYIKLLFVSLVMLEEKKGWGEAIKVSWKLTDGNFWPLFWLIAINTIAQSLALGLTVIGFIPVTGYVNTARAAAFRMLLDDSRESATTA